MPWHLLLPCLFAHEYDEAGGVLAYFNLQMSYQVSTVAAFGVFSGMSSSQQASPAY